MVEKPRRRGAGSSRQVGEWMWDDRVVPIDWTGTCLFDIRDGEVHAKNTLYVVESSDVYLY